MLDDSTFDYIRVALLLFVVVTGTQLAHAYVTDDTRTDVSAYDDQQDLALADRQAVTGERDNVTVVSAKTGLYAFTADGRVLYYNDSHPYFDVDPSERGDTTVMTADHGPPLTDGCEKVCTENRIAYTNLSTGTRTVVYAHVTPQKRNSNWHDVDRVSEYEYLIAGMREDRAYRINVSSDTTEWGIHLRDVYDRDAGGPLPVDFAHLNDVEELPDGRVMLSPRNMDSVLFIHPKRGLQPNWTLGGDDEFDTLYEQHNPDYIPESRGGPAVLVSDSENNRIVEYQRVDGVWAKSWQYTSAEMAWPRDADRLPNGHTLITDSHADRVIEVDRDGDIVWQARVPIGYDAERLGTGDESAGGPSARRANLTSVGSTTIDRYHGVDMANEAEWTQWRSFWHGINFYLPSWMDGTELVRAVGVVAAMLCWATLELYLRGWRLRRPITNNV
jgi:hypothetical protein